MQDLLVILCLVLLAAVAVLMIWGVRQARRARRGDHLLRQIQDLPGFGAYGFAVFSDDGSLCFITPFARDCLEFVQSFLTQPNRVDFDACLDYLKFKSAQAYRELGGIAWRKLQGGVQGEFHEIAAMQGGRYCLAQGHSFKDGRRAIIFSAYDVMFDARDDGEKTDKMESLARLAGGIAHDFNNVLSIVDGYSKLASKEGLIIDVVHQYLAKISAAVQRGAKLTHKMMVFSDQRPKTNCVIDVSKVLKAREALLFASVPSHVRAVSRLNVKNAYVCSFDDALLQILQPVIENAAEAMPNGGMLTLGVQVVEARYVPFVETATAEAYICITVTDQGEGMPLSLVQKAFDPFFTTKAHGQKSGLGLSIVYGLVRQLGGEIYIRSTPHRGTDVEIYLPQSNENPTHEVVGGLDDPQSIRLNGYTVLLVDDEEDLVAVVSSMLRDMGMTVFTAPDGNAALMFHEEYDGQIDLLLTDLVMTDLDGMRLAEMMVCEREHMKVIFMSGYPASMEGRRLPDDSLFMTKPFDYDALARTVYSHLHGEGRSGGHRVDRWENNDDVKKEGIIHV
jgi:signal transduction histidine kinase/CheY-like chemotaxis protein